MVKNNISVIDESIKNINHENIFNSKANDLENKILKFKEILNHIAFLSNKTNTHHDIIKLSEQIFTLDKKANDLAASISYELKSLSDIDTKSISETRIRYLHFNNLISSSHKAFINFKNIKQNLASKQKDILYEANNNLYSTPLINDQLKNQIFNSVENDEIIPTEEIEDSIKKIEDNVNKINHILENVNLLIRKQNEISKYIETEMEKTLPIVEDGKVQILKLKHIKKQSFSIIADIKEGILTVENYLYYYFTSWIG